MRPTGMDETSRAVTRERSLPREVIAAVAYRVKPFDGTNILIGSRNA